MKRLDWARANIGGDFSDVVYTDECSIRMESYRRFSCHKRGERPKNKPRLVVNTGILVPQVQVDVENACSLYVHTYASVLASTYVRCLCIYMASYMHCIAAGHPCEPFNYSKPLCYSYAATAFNYSFLFQSRI